MCGSSSCWCVCAVGSCLNKQMQWSNILTTLTAQTADEEQIETIYKTINSIEFQSITTSEQLSLIVSDIPNNVLSPAGVDLDIINSLLLKNAKSLPKAVDCILEIIMKILETGIVKIIETGIVGSATSIQSFSLCFFDSLDEIFKLESTKQSQIQVLKLKKTCLSMMMILVKSPECAETLSLKYPNVITSLVDSLSAYLKASTNNLDYIRLVLPVLLGVAKTKSNPLLVPYSIIFKVLKKVCGSKYTDHKIVASTARCCISILTCCCVTCSICQELHSLGVIDIVTQQLASSLKAYSTNDKQVHQEILQFCNILFKKWSDAQLEVENEKDDIENMVLQIVQLGKHASSSSDNDSLDVLHLSILALCNVSASVKDQSHSIISDLDWIHHLLNTPKPKQIESAVYQLLQQLSLIEGESGISTEKETLYIICRMLKNIGVGNRQDRGKYWIPTDTTYFKESISILINVSVVDKLAQRICFESGSGLFDHLFALCEKYEKFNGRILSLIRNLCIDRISCNQVVQIGYEYLLRHLIRGSIQVRTECSQIIYNVMIQNPNHFELFHSLDELIPEYLASLTLNFKSHKSKLLQHCSLDLITFLMNIDDALKRVSYRQELIKYGVIQSLHGLLCCDDVDAKVKSRASLCLSELRLFQSTVGDVKSDPWKYVAVKYSMSQGKKKKKA